MASITSRKKDYQWTAFININSRCIQEKIRKYNSPESIMYILNYYLDEMC